MQHCETEREAGVETDEFTNQVADRLGDAVEVDTDEAVHAVLVALASRLGHDDAVELGSELPEALGDVLATAAGDQPFERDAFIEDVASKLDLDDVDAE